MKFDTRLKAAALGFAVLSSMGLGIALAEGFNGLSAAAPDGQVAAPGAGMPGMHEGMHRGDHHGMRDGGKFMEQLGLTDAQKQQLKTLNEQFRKDNAATIQDMKSKFTALKALPKDDSSKTQRQQLMASLKQDRQLLHGKRKAMMDQVLTPEQKTKMEALHQQWRSQHPGGHHRGMGGPGAEAAQQAQ